jgi:hypothetical protein
MQNAWESLKLISGFYRADLLASGLFEEREGNEITTLKWMLRGPYTINHVAQHCVLCNMIDPVWC